MCSFCFLKTIRLHLQPERVWSKVKSFFSFTTSGEVRNLFFFSVSKSYRCLNCPSGSSNDTKLFAGFQWKFPDSFYRFLKMMAHGTSKASTFTNLFVTFFFCFLNQKKHLSEKLGSDETFHQIGCQVITPDVLPGDALFDELGSLLPEVQVIWWSWMGGWQLEVSSLDLRSHIDPLKTKGWIPKMMVFAKMWFLLYIWNGHFWYLC